MKKSFQQPAVKHPLQGDLNQLLQYRLGVRFDPGAEAEVFESLIQNPVYLFRGPGRVAGSLKALQPPQIFFNPQIGAVGIPTQAGTLYSQPLLDPSQESSTFEGA